LPSNRPFLSNTLMEHHQVDWLTLRWPGTSQS